MSQRALWTRVGITLMYVLGSTAPVAAQQGGSGVRVAAALVSVNLEIKPVPLHALRLVPMYGDSTPIGFKTGLDGKASQACPAAAYRLESVSPVTLDGKRYGWSVELRVPRGKTVAVKLTNANATIETTPTTAAPSQSAADTSQADTGKPIESGSLASQGSTSDSGQPVTSPMPPRAPTLAVPTAPAAATMLAPLVAPVPPPVPGRSRADLLTDHALRLGIDDVRRLEIAVDFQETRLGLLRLTLGPGFASVSSARFNLERLYTVYRATVDENEVPLIELWRDGAKVGEVTSNGVLVGPDFRTPR
jgi:hypothetical protein